MKRIHDRFLFPEVDLQFDEANHAYSIFDPCSETYAPAKSVTQLIKSYSEPFDSAAHSARIAERDGITQAEILDAWESKATAASEQGTYVHGQAEEIAYSFNRSGRLSLNVVGHPPEYRGHLKALWSWFIDHPEIAQGFLVSELQIGFPCYLLAGTVDMLASSYQGMPAIIDWKTNASLETEGYRNMLPPFSRGKLKLPDTNLFHYYLQLNAYRRILLEEYNYEAQSMMLVHLQSNGRYVEYNVPVMEKHVDRLLEERLKVIACY